MMTTNDSFRLFLRFSFEIMDRYGRFLCYINRNQPDPNLPAPRPPSLNERLLMSGMAFPSNYWTIVNPEDQLFIPEEYVPLFVSKGWQQQPAP